MTTTPTKATTASRAAKAFALSALATFTIASPAAASTLLGPSPYSTSADSPFAGLSFSSFYLEDFQDDAVNTTGLIASGGQIYTSAKGSLSDSLEFTPFGRTYFGGGSAGLVFTFDATALGALPTHAGLVWVDGAGTITFEAFDQNGVSLGILTGDHADNSITGTTAEDRFYGAINAGGISRLVISNTSGGIEVDHVQYGLQSLAGAVPEPGTWALLVLGFGLIGAGMRKRQTPTVAFA